MKKLMVAIAIMIMALAVPAFGQVDITGPETHGALSPITGVNAQAGATASATGGAGGAGGNATINDNSRTTNNNTNLNTNLNSNTLTNHNSNIQGQNQGQSQGQMQGQGQLQGQGQMNNWSQTYNAPRDLLSAPSVAPPAVGIVVANEGRLPESDVPNIGIPSYNGEVYIKAKSYNGSIINRVRIEDLAEDLLVFKNRILGKKGWLPSKIRMAVYVRLAGETTSTSGSGGGSYSANPTAGSGIAGTAGLIPGKARWKSDCQYTVVFYLIK